MLPLDEFNALTDAITHAHDLAEAGRAVDGYTILLQRVQRAQGAHDRGLDWSKELLRRYREACDDFAKLYRVGRA